MVAFFKIILYNNRRHLRIGSIARSTNHSLYPWENRSSLSCYRRGKQVSWSLSSQSWCMYTHLSALKSEALLKETRLLNYIESPRLYYHFRAIGYLPATLFWPIIPFILISGTIALWIFVDLNLRSIAISEGVYYANSTVGLRNKSSEEWTAWALNSSMKCDPTVSWSPLASN